MTSKEKDDDFNPFEGVDAAIVLQECRAFHDREINVRKCCSLITKILYLLGKGERITKDDATNLFFGATKLLQSKDPSLRRLVYLIFRELSSIVSPEERIIVTATLVNGMKDPNEIYRSASIRVLAHIIDSNMFGGEIERKLKESVVEKSDVVASAALVAGKNLFERQAATTDVVRRWVGEISTSLQSRSATVQMQALNLLWAIRKHDRLAVAKMVGQLIRTALRSPIAQCLRLRLVGKVMEEDAGADRSLYEFVEGCLRHKSEMVMLEAARVLSSVSHISRNDLIPALTVLQLFLSSPRLTTRFAAIRTLNRVAMTHPTAVQPCNPDIEVLMTESNRSIATLAMTTLLKTATDSNVDRLMKQISGFMAEIADEFKVVVVKAIRSLCLKFPEKFAMFLGFLSHALREEGGFEFKENIVEALCEIMQTIPASKEPGLAHLCEFIEDCEFARLSVRVLNIIGQVGPTTTSPQRLLRCVFNRMVLENGAVRAAAVDSIAAFGQALDGDAKRQVSLLLARCAHDGDDEVRDRAILHSVLLSGNPLPAVTRSLTIDLGQLEKELMLHCRGNQNTQLFNLTAAEEEISKRKPKKPAGQPQQARGAAAATNTPSQQVGTGTGTRPAGPSFLSIPELAGCGPLFRSSRPHEVTEPDSDYVVTCTKHVFSAHLVLQFDVTNTVDAYQLENVVVECDVGGVEGLQVQSVVPSATLPAHVGGSVYVLMTRGASLQGVIVNTLKFNVRDVDTATGDVGDDTHEDEYQLEDIALTPADLTKPSSVADFRSVWEAMGTAGNPERVEVYTLAFKKITVAVSTVVDLLGMCPFEGTNKLREEDKARRHTLLCSGLCFPDIPVMCIVNFAFDQANQIHIRVSVRATREAACLAVLACVAT